MKEGILTIIDRDSFSNSTISYSTGPDFNERNISGESERLIIGHFLSALLRNRSASGQRTGWFFATSDARRKLHVSFLSELSSTYLPLSNSFLPIRRNLPILRRQLAILRFYVWFKMHPIQWKRTIAIKGQTITITRSLMNRDIGRDSSSEWKTPSYSYWKKFLELYLDKINRILSC